MGNPIVNAAIKAGPWALAIGGAAAGAAGGALADKAEQTKRTAREAHESKRQEAQQQVMEIQQRINEVNEYRQQQWDATLIRLTAWFEANERKLRKTELEKWDLEPLEIAADELPEVGKNLRKRSP